MINVHVGRVAARGRTLKSPQLDHLLLKAKRDWIIAAKAIRSILEAEIVKGAWPHSMAQKLQHWVTEMAETEARIDMLIMVDVEVTSVRDSDGT